MEDCDSYETLKARAAPGRDYRILIRTGRSGIAVLAPHGGGIEPGTVDIADALAGDTHSFYAFMGIRKSGNRDLHITSTRFDEPSGVAVAAAAQIAVTVHGHHDKACCVYIGGRHQALMQRISAALRDHGFTALISTRSGLGGLNPQNICNRCRSGRGVQLEISRGLREQLFEHLDRRSIRSRTVKFHRFVRAIADALEKQVEN